MDIDTISDCITATLIHVYTFINFDHKIYVWSVLFDISKVVNYALIEDIMQIIPCVV